MSDGLERGEDFSSGPGGRKGTDCLAELPQKSTGEKSPADVVGLIQMLADFLFQCSKKRMTGHVGKDQPCKSAAQEVVTAWGQTDAKPGQAGQKTGGHLPVSLPD